MLAYNAYSTNINYVEFTTEMSRAQMRNKLHLFEKCETWYNRAKRWAKPNLVIIHHIKLVININIGTCWRPMFHVAKQTLSTTLRTLATSYDLEQPQKQKNTLLSKVLSYVQVYPSPVRFCSWSILNTQKDDIYHLGPAFWPHLTTIRSSTRDYTAYNIQIVVMCYSQAALINT